MSNLPSGADNDPLAPWNRTDLLCRYCDEDVLLGYIKKQIADDPDCQDDCVDEEIERRLSEQPLCKDCAKEEYYDYNFDDDDN